MVAGVSAPFEDARGTFLKVLGAGRLEPDGFRASEIFWSRSVAGTLRGMHVLLPPYASSRVVFVVDGAVTDFVLDLRVDSPTYGCLAEIPLTPDTGGLFIPAGCAHGFAVMGHQAVMVYAQEGPYSAEHDAGVSLSSLDVDVPPTARISERDRSLPALADFDSPFRMDEVS